MHGVLRLKVSSLRGSLQSMLKKIYYNVFSIKSFYSFILATIGYYLLYIFGAIDTSHFYKVPNLHKFAVLVLLFFLFEVIIKKDMVYMFFLYLMSAPIQHFFTSNKFLFFNLYNLLTINYNLVFICIFLCKVILLNNLRLKICNHRIIFAFYGCLIMSVISIFDVKNAFLAFNGVIYGLLIPFVLFIIVLYIIKDKENLFLCYDAFIISTLFFNILTFILEFSDLIIPGFRHDRIVGIFVNPGHYGVLQLCAGSISLFLLTKRLNIIYFITFVSSITAILLSGNRSIFISFIIFYILYIHQMGLKRKIAFYYISVAILVFFVIDFTSSKLFLGSITIFRLYEKGFDTPRYNIWMNTINYIIDNKLFFKGVGLGNFVYSLFPYVHSSSAHNSLLHLAATIGVFGSFLYHYIIIYSINLKNIIFKINKTRTIPQIILFSILVSMVIGGFQPLMYSQEGIINYGIDPLTMNTHLMNTYLWLFIAFSNYTD